jgi:diaminopimelate decarboxylase
MNASLATDLIAKHGTPLYAYDLSAVSARATELLSYLPAGSRLYYSFKANPHCSIVHCLREHGIGAEITSTGELQSALEAGHTQGMVFGGPGKTSRSLKRVLECGVRQFSCESFHDAQRISDAANIAGVDVTAILRVNPSQAPDARLAMSGVESQFGFDEALLLQPDARERLDLPRIKWNGVHVYFGTQIQSVQALGNNTRAALATAERVSQFLGMECSVVNVGGGFPWPYATESQGPDLTGLADELTAAWKASPLSASAKLAFESGRYLSASAGTLLTTVLDVKKAGQRTFIVLDTGIHHLGGMSGLGRIPRSAMTFINLTAQRAEEVTADIVGPLCSPLDCLARGHKMSAVEVGDLLAIPNVGAYGLSASLTRFLSHDLPAEIPYNSCPI